MLRDECQPVKLEMSAASTPSDGVPIGGDIVEVVGAQFDNKYFELPGAAGGAKAQWYEVGDTISQPYDIHRLEVTVCFRSKDYTKPGVAETWIELDGESIGVDGYIGQCDWQCITSYFPTRPGCVDAFPLCRFDWDDVNNIKVGIVSGSVPEENIMQVDRVYLRVICGDQYSPCPTCCCCCLCFSPCVTIGEWTVGNDLTGTGDWVIPEVGPFCLPELGIPGPTGGGCAFSANSTIFEDPVFVATDGVSDMYLIGILVEGGVTNPELTGCIIVTATFAQFPAGSDPEITPFINSFQFTWTPDLVQCDPAHRSEDDAPVASLVNSIPVTCDGSGTECGGPCLVSCPSIEVTC